MKILICDDEYATRLITKSYLEMYSIDTLEASNGSDAIAIIKEENPDLLIIDYSMPDITGLEVIKKIEGQIPSIVVTSEGFTENTEKEIKELAASYMVKPVTEETLIGTIEKVTGKKLKNE